MGEHEKGKNDQNSTLSGGLQADLCCLVRLYVKDEFSLSRKNDGEPRAQAKSLSFRFACPYFSFR